MKKNNDEVISVRDVLCNEASVSGYQSVDYCDG